MSGILSFKLEVIWSYYVAVIISRYANPLAEEGRYSAKWTPAWTTCPQSADPFTVPCRDFRIPSAPNFANNLTCCSVCKYPHSDYVDTGFWSDIIAVDVCEDFWDASISDDPIAKYNDSLVYGNKFCRAVTGSACGPNRVVASSILRWQPDDTNLGAFDSAPYSRVSQPTAALFMLLADKVSHISLVCLLFLRLRMGEVWEPQTRRVQRRRFKCNKEQHQKFSYLDFSSSSANPTLSKNAARAIAMNHIHLRTMQGMLGVILLCL